MIAEPGTIVQLNPDQTNKYDTMRPFLVVAKISSGLLVLPLTTSDCNHFHNIEIKKDRKNKLSHDSFIKVGRPSTVTESKVLCVIGSVEPFTIHLARISLASILYPVFDGVLT